jgi:hypothetical protein
LFFAAADDYAEILRLGLEQARCEKGADHEEPLALQAAFPDTTNSWDGFLQRESNQSHYWCF